MLTLLATRRALTATMLVAGGVLIAGCGGSANNGSAQLTGASKKVLAFTRAADLSSESAGYQVHMVMSETVAGAAINLSAHGSYAPKSHDAAMTLDMALPATVGGEVQFQMVMSNGTFYMKFPTALAGKLPGAKPWLSINLDELGKAANMPNLGSLMSSYSSLDNPGAYLDFLRAASAGSVTDVGQETIDGVQTTHYEAELQFSKLADAVPASDRQSAQQLLNQLQSKVSVPDFPVDVWIDGSDLVRRLMMNIKETVEGQAVDAQLTENFSDYGTQPAPTIPSPDQTTDMLSLIKAGA